VEQSRETFMNTRRGCIAQTEENDPWARQVSGCRNLWEVQVHCDDQSLVCRSAAQDLLICGAQQPKRLNVDRLMALSGQPGGSLRSQWRVDEEAHGGSGHGGWRQGDDFLTGDPGGVFNRFRDVRRLQVGVGLQDLSRSLTRSQEIQDLMDGKPHPTDAGLSVQDSMINRNAGKGHPR